MTKHEYICKICETVSSKSTCNRANVGAVFTTEDYEILSTGYNGAPRGFNECNKYGHIINNGHCIRTVHAEQNAIIQAAKRGIKLEKSILYITHSPCGICAKMIINLNITEIRCKKIYSFEGKTILNQGNIPLYKWFEIK